MIGRLLIVGAGGFAGAILRYLLTLWFLPWTERSGFPYGTFVANMVGCLLIGVLTGWFLSREASPEIRLLILTGFLGALTTFSTFSLESLLLLQGERIGVGLLNIVLQVLLGVSAAWVGLQLVPGEG